MNCTYLRPICHTSRHYFCCQLSFWTVMNFHQCAKALLNKDRPLKIAEGSKGCSIIEYIYVKMHTTHYLVQLHKSVHTYCESQGVLCIQDWRDACPLQTWFYVMRVIVHWRKLWTRSQHDSMRISLRHLWWKDTTLNLTPFWNYKQVAN